MDAIPNTERVDINHPGYSITDAKAACKSP